MLYRLLPAVAIAVKILSVTVLADFVSPSDSRIVYVGRCDRSNENAVKMSWAGTQVRARFEGTACSAIIDETADSSAYNVIIDGVLVDSIAVFADKDTHQLVSGLSDGIHDLILYKRSESKSSPVLFKGFILPEGNALAAAPALPQRKIEFIGDSHTNALAVGAEGWQDKNVYNNNVYASFAAITSRFFNTQAVMTAVSGKGLVHNHSDTEMISDTAMPEYFNRTVTSLPEPEWNHSSWIPDLVVINLGTNDFAESRQATFNGHKWRRPVHPDTFSTAYHSFLDTLRATYSGAKLILVAPYDPCGSVDSVTHAIERIYDTEKSQGANDLALVTYPAFEEGDYVCCHPGPGYNQRIAESLAVTVEELVGWGPAAVKKSEIKSGRLFFSRERSKIISFPGHRGKRANAAFDLKGRAMEAPHMRGENNAPGMGIGIESLDSDHHEK